MHPIESKYQKKKKKNNTKEKKNINRCVKYLLKKFENRGIVLVKPNDIRKHNHVPI